MEEYPDLDALEAAALADYLNLLKKSFSLDRYVPLGKPHNPKCTCCFTTSFIVRRNVGGRLSTVWKICSECDKSGIKEDIMKYFLD